MRPGPGTSASGPGPASARRQRAARPRPTTACAAVMDGRRARLRVNASPRAAAACLIDLSAWFPSSPLGDFASTAPPSSSRRTQRLVVIVSSLCLGAAARRRRRCLASALPGDVEGTCCSCGGTRSRTTWPIPLGSNFTYILQAKVQIGTYYYFPSLAFHKATSGIGGIRGIRVLSSPMIPAVPLPPPAADYTVLIGD
ncbi:hypothetical protein ABZP36_029338 [Zizania latifolia]